MTTNELHSKEPSGKRVDARRNAQTVLDAAAELFVTFGVDVPVRDIAARAGVGTGTLYRHFPTRADLIVAVYRHQVDTCAEVGEDLLRSAAPYAALKQWIHLFADFLITKQGLASVMQSTDPSYSALHTYFLERLVPVGAQLIGAAAAASKIRRDVTAFELLRGVGNLCIGAGSTPDYSARRLIDVLLDGLCSIPLEDSVSEVAVRQ
ncbi:TetR family transcriptional regulator [Deinococcus sp. HMF7620]|uniref:TetR family transcriptional regulator n=1 Tax=Deinococcus arboris TaxID=2682977 RepID=A0A7C9HT23_9DEIO|nr:TetR/AcrR family transcriptional regulator [Deinococcus arboris]MVN88252.1 TetR family transcriptional regulator [Deinococcus arboris]